MINRFKSNLLIVRLRMWKNFWKKSSTANQTAKKLPTTHNCMKLTLILAQWIGIFPVSNLAGDEVCKIEFQMKSWKIAYTFLMSFDYMFCTIFSFHKSVTTGILLNQLITPLFYLHAFLTSVCFLQLAYKWPKFLNHWFKIEVHILKTYKTTTDLYKKVNYFALLMFIVSLLEHSLSISNFLYTTNCQNDSEGAEYLFKKQFHFIFTYMPYNFFCGLLLMFLSWPATLAWNFGDIFIILISIIMTERLKQINQKIKTTTDEIAISYSKSFSSVKSGRLQKVKSEGDYHLSDPKLWRQIREDFDSIINIIRILDKLLSNLILLSYSCNLTFILIQLFNSLRQMGSVIEAIYFFYSFGFVIIRIVFVSIFGAYINEESQACLPYLTSLPTEFFNDEIQRLITQIHVGSAALTGRNFFRITKGLVLSVAAAIITYELVLIQFNQATLNKLMAANETICF